MHARAVLLAALGAVALPAAAEVSVRQVGDTLSVQATAAPVSEVLDHLARQTGMQVVYEGTPPRLPVTLSIERRTPAEVVFSLLEGLGLNYALRLDESSRRVLTLVMAGAAASVPDAARGAPGAGAQAVRRNVQPYPPPGYPHGAPSEDYRDPNLEPIEPGFDPNTGVIPPPPPQPPQEFVVNPRPQPEPEQQQQQQPSFTAPSLGSGFSSPFSSSGFSSPSIIGNPPLPAQPAPPPPQGVPEEPRENEKQP